LTEAISGLDQTVRFNVNEIIETAYRVTHIDVSKLEINQFFDKYIKGMNVDVDKEET